MSVNKVILVGRLGNDPEVRTTPSGATVANFNLATNEYWTDKSGQRQEKTEWHRVVLWGRQAELAGQYLGKGRQVYLEGSMQTRSWEDNSGNKRYTTEVRGQTMKFIGPGGPQASSGDGMSQDNNYSQQSAAATPAPQVEEPSFTDDDIPF